MMRSRSHEHEQPALELLDEYWFFSNTLASSSNSKDQAAERGEFRQSSPPSSGSSSGHQQQQEEEDDDLNWSSIYEGVLRTRMAEGSSRSRPAALRRAPSMPVPAAGGGGPGPGPASSTQPRSNRPMSQKQLARSRSISVFQHDDKNKCRRSSSDLAGVDKDDQLRGSSSSLKKPAGSSSRPPALVRVQSEARSAAEVKDQLRMWAQAVACNVRQEC